MEVGNELGGWEIGGLVVVVVGGVVSGLVVHVAVLLLLVLGVAIVFECKGRLGVCLIAIFMLMLLVI